MFLLSEAYLSEGPTAEEHGHPRILSVEGLVKDWHTFIERRTQSVLGKATRVPS
jgi:hypothetical protein